MNVAIHTLPDSSRHRSRGIGVYTRLLVDALCAYAPQHTYHTDLDTHGYRDIDLIHYPYFDPFFLTLPFFSPKPTVVTVHDLIPFVFPDHFSRGIRGRMKWEMQKMSLRRKERIITDSLCSKDDIVRFTGIQEAMIDVVPLAPSLRLPEGENPKKGDTHKKYFIYVGDVNWNKNISGLLLAFASFVKNHDDIDLILVGKAFCDETLREAQQIRFQIQSLGIEQYVKTPGYVREEELIRLLTNAQALIQPSYYEGFGFSVLDAMTMGCPVIVSNVASLQEIAGPSLLIDPNHKESFIQAMEQIYTMDKKSRSLLVQKGYAWVQTFTWQNVAQKTVRAYEKVLEHI